MPLHTVTSEGADIVYERDGDGPILLMISGAGGLGSIYAKSARILKNDYTVISYDRRCNGDSTGDRHQTLDMAQQARDAAAVIAATGADAAYVFGSSGGANIALKLAEDSPHVVTGLVVHEAPVISILPDAREQIAKTDAIYGTFEAKGATRAMIQFMKTLTGVNPVKLMLAGSKPDFEFFFAREYLPISHFAPNLSTIRGHGLPVVALAGSASRDAYYARASAVIAEALDCRSVTISGNHFSYMLKPDVFARELRVQLSALGAA